MSRPVERQLPRKLSITCNRAPHPLPQRAIQAYRHQSEPRLRSEHATRRVRYGEFCRLAVFLGALLVGWLPGAWAAEAEEKQPLKLPEVVILGEDVSVLKEAKERLVPQELTQTLKEIPAEARENIDLSAPEQAGKTSPQVSSPGCLFGNPVTDDSIMAFALDESK